MKTWIIYLTIISFVAGTYQFLPDSIQDYSILIYIFTLFSYYFFAMYLVMRLTDEPDYKKYENFDM